MATPLANAPIQAAAGAGAGSGGAAQITGTTETGDRGLCQITLGPGTAGGVLATISFAGGTPGSGPRGRTTQLFSGTGWLAVGSLADPDIRPIVLTVYPAPPGTVSFQAVPVVSGAQMTGFQIVGSGALGPGGTFTFAWVVL